MKGKLIVIYGINNLGKTTQAKLLVDHIKKEGKKAIYLKYPIYDLGSVGKLINEYLRQGNPLNFSSREFQMLNAYNRAQYAPILESKLENGTNIITEDYIGTSIAWGVGRGVDQNFLIDLNSDLLKEDLAFLFDGQRFKESVEKNHTHEENDDLTETVRQVHLDLAETFDWKIIDANRSIEEIHQEVWESVRSII